MKPTNASRIHVAVEPFARGDAAQPEDVRPWRRVQTLPEDVLTQAYSRGHVSVSEHKRVQ